MNTQERTEVAVYRYKYLPTAEKLRILQAQIIEMGKIITSAQKRMDELTDEFRRLSE